MHFLYILSGFSFSFVKSKSLLGDVNMRPFLCVG